MLVAQRCACGSRRGWEAPREAVPAVVRCGRRRACRRGISDPAGAGTERSYHDGLLVMAETSINPQGTAGTGGRATPVAFALAFVGGLLVAYTFVRLTQRFHHSGSVYGFVGATIGPRAGVVSGWALSGTYIFYAVTTAMAGGRFASNFLNPLGIWKNPPTWSGFLLGAIGLALVWWIAITPARSGTRLLLAAEGITVALIVIVIVIVFAKLAGHAGPGQARRQLVDFQPAVRHPAVRDLPRSRVRVPVLRWLRGRRDSRRGDQPSQPRHPASHPRSRDLGRDLLLRGDRRRGDGLRDLGSGSQGLHLLDLPDRRSRHRLRLLLDRQHHHGRGDGLGLRLRAGLHGRLLPAHLRDGQGRHLARPSQPGLARPAHSGDIDRRRGADRLRRHRLHLVHSVGRPVHAIRPGRNDRDADPARGVHPGHDRNGPAGSLHRADGGAPLGDRDPRRRHHRARLHPVPERLAVAYRGGLVGAVGGDLLDRDRADLGAGPPCRYPAGWSGPGGMCRSNQEMARVRKSMLAG